MGRKQRSLLGFVFVAIGIFMFFYPEILNYQQQKNMQYEIKIFKNKKKLSKDKDSFYKKSLKYDQKIYDEGQKNLKDVWSYEAPPVQWGKRCFGYIKIRKMNIELPLYLGATLENMKKGAVIMGGTSLPLGRKNSNCVIAAHRGYKGIPYFREIERLKAGDKIVVKNPWEKLSYIVETIKIINPDDSDKIRIREGKDMITLLTCHPYQGQGRFRYVVYCIRDHGQKVSRNKEDTGKEPGFRSSQGDIFREKIVRYIGCMILIFIIIKIIEIKRKQGGEQHGEQIDKKKN